MFGADLGHGLALEPLNDDHRFGSGVPMRTRRLEARHPPIYRWTRDVQDATDTELIPALTIELDDLDPGPTAVSLAVIVTQR